MPIAAGGTFGMLSLLLLLVVVLLGSAPVNVNAISAGFQATLTNKGIEYAREVAIPIVTKELQGLTIPDISGDADTPIGHVDYSLTNIKASNVNLGTSSIATSTGGIGVSFSSVSVAMNADWSYREKSWPHVKDHGSADVSASSISLSVNIVLSLSSTNEPQIAVNSCSSDIGHLDIKFHGGASWLYNLFSHFIADEIKKSLNKELCSQIEGTLVNEGNKILDTLPETIKLDECALIDFTFLQAPVTTNTYLLTDHKGEFFQIAHPVEAPFTPPNLPQPTNATRMFYIALSAYTLETGAWVYSQCGVLDFYVKPSDVPSDWPIALNTSSIGKFLPNLQKKYPNRPMDLWINASATAPIIATITPGKAQANIYLDLTAYVELANASRIDVFGIKLNVSASAQAWVSADNYIHFNLTFLDVAIALNHTNIGPIDVSGINAIIEFFCKNALLPGLNKAMAKGIPLPTVDGVSFVNSQVSFKQGYLVVDTDIHYTPSTSSLSLHANKCV